MKHTLLFRLSPLRVIERWDALYWELDFDSDDARERAPVPRRTRFAWWCQGHIATGTAIWHVIMAPRDRMSSDYSEIALWGRLFYGAKAILCLLIGRDGVSLDEVGYERMTESFKVVYFDLQEYGTLDGPGGSCQEVHVGGGILKRWFAYIERENWP